MKSTSRLILAAFLACLVIRVLFVVWPATPLRTKVIASIGDAAEYEQLATNLAQHHVFSRDTVPPYRPEIFRTPGYPLVIAPAFLATSAHLQLALLLQLLLSLAIVWAVLRFGIEKGLEPKTAAIAGLLVGLSPNLGFIATRLVTETLFTLLLVVCLLLVNRYRLRSRAVDLVAAGMCAGLLILVRPIAMYFPLVLAAYVLYLRLRDRKRWLGAVLLPLVSATVGATPWVIRNGATTGRYVVSTVSDRSIYLYTAATVVASKDHTTLAEARDRMFAEAIAEFGPLDTGDEATLWPALSKVAWQHVLSEPLVTARVLALGFASNFVQPIGISPLLVHSGALEALTARPHAMQNAVSALARGQFGRALGIVWNDRLAVLPWSALLILGIATLFHAMLMVLAVTGMIVRRGRGLLWLLVPLLYFTMLTGPVGEARFRAPVEPLLCLFAAVAASRRTKPAQKRTDPV